MSRSECATGSISACAFTVQTAAAAILRYLPPLPIVTTTISCPVRRCSYGARLDRWSGTSRSRVTPTCTRMGLKTSWDERPKVSYQVHNTGTVRAFEQWPPPATRKARFFLAKGPTGTVKSLNDGALSPSPRAADGGATSYTYPHPSWVFGNVSVGPAGPDPAAGTLTFTSEPLERDLELAGHGKLVVYGSTTRNDMDVIIKVSEQFAQSAEERAKGIQPRYSIVTKGWLRASHQGGRDSRVSTDDIPVYTHAKQTPLKSGQIYKLEIPLLPHAWRFAKGSRIRLEISCADSPITDFLFSHVYRPDKHGTDTIHHDAEHPSELILPVLDD